jgi:hypothetical protein
VRIAVNPAGGIPAGNRVWTGLERSFAGMPDVEGGGAGMRVEATRALLDLVRRTGNIRVDAIAAGFDLADDSGEPVRPRAILRGAACRERVIPVLRESLGSALDVPSPDSISLLTAGPCTLGLVGDRYGIGAGSVEDAVAVARALAGEGAGSGGGPGPGTEPGLHVWIRFRDPVRASILGSLDPASAPIMTGLLEVRVRVGEDGSVAARLFYAGTEQAALAAPLLAARLREAAADVRAAGAMIPPLTAAAGALETIGMRVEGPEVRMEGTGSPDAMAGALSYLMLGTLGGG